MNSDTKKQIKDELDNTQYDYMCAEDNLISILAVMLSEKYFSQDTYDLIIAKIDIMRRKNTHLHDIGQNILANIPTTKR